MTCYIGTECEMAYGNKIGNKQEWV